MARSQPAPTQLQALAAEMIHAGSLSVPERQQDTALIAAQLAFRSLGVETQIVYRKLRNRKILAAVSVLEIEDGLVGFTGLADWNGHAAYDLAQRNMGGRKPNFYPDPACVSALSQKPDIRTVADMHQENQLQPPGIRDLLLAQVEGAQICLAVIQPILEQFVLQENTAKAPSPSRSKMRL